MDRIYLDNNATTALAPEVLDALMQHLDELPGNPSSVHWYGQQAKATLTKARRAIAKVLGVKMPELLFNSCGTEAANQLMRGFLSAGDHLITSDQEHACVFNTAKDLESQGIDVTYLHPAEQGAPDAEMLSAALRPETRLIVLTAVNTETGVRTDIAALAEVAAAAGIPFVVDGVGLLGRAQVQVPAGVTAMFFSGHKIHAPKGVGCTVLRQRSTLRPLLSGGSQEFGRRAGTENLPGIVALAKAVELVGELFPEAEGRIAALRDRFEQRITEGFPDAVINGAGQERICNTSNIGFPGVDGESLLMHLDLQGLACSHGSACSSGAVEPSRVLLAMGLSRELAASSLRFSLSRFTTEDEIDRAAELVVTTVRELAKLSQAST